MGRGIGSRIATFLAIAILGGCIGAAFTAATSSQASPSAIAAAIQKVQDRTAERELQTIGFELLRFHEEDHTSATEISALLNTIRTDTYQTCFDSGANEVQRSGCHAF